ncbi:glutamine--fructose-6-phosphate transaminase (isomerizing) [Patescibacteria group bacterium]
MCGVFGYIGEERPNLSGFLLGGLTKLEYRGYDSSGIAVFNGTTLNLIKEEGPLKNIIEKIGKRKLSGNLGIGHTRWATHGKVTIKNSHPQTDCTGKIIVVHNGIIENFRELKRDLIKKGHKFTSETDTEVIPHLIEEIIKDKKVSFKEAVRLAFKKCSGLNAIVATNGQGQIVGYRNGSPLVVGVGENGNFISSDTPGLSFFTRDIVFLDDNQGVVVEKNRISLVELRSGKEKAAKHQKIKMGEKDAGKGKFKHYLLKEIHEQPRVVSRIADNNKKEIQRIAQEIKNAYGTYFTACGTAAYAGMAATYMFSEIANRHVNFTIASEFAYFENFLVEKSLLIAASQSGETMDTLEAVRAVKRHKSKVLALVNVPGSSLERMADFTLHLKAGPERAVLSTKAYIAKLSTFLLLAFTIAGKYEKGISVLKNTAKEIKNLINGNLENKVKKIARNIYKAGDIYLIGRGVNYPTALEGALKIKEVSYIHAEGFPGGELKHGTIALIEKGTPCFVIAANDNARSEIIANAEEISARGAYIIGVSPFKEKVFDEWIKVPDIKYASSIVSVVPLQLMGYYLAVLLGRDPDKPRNLAKSVTVK